MEESSDVSILFFVRGLLPFVGVGISPIPPNCSGVRSLPQTLIAESMPVDSLDPKSMGEMKGQIQEHVTLFRMDLETAKLAWCLATLLQAMIAHV